MGGLDQLPSRHSASFYHSTQAAHKDPNFLMNYKVVYNDPSFDTWFKLISRDLLISYDVC